MAPDADRAADPGELHRFWFADALTDPSRAESRMGFWFRSDSATDAVIAQRFSPTLRRAVQGRLGEWESTARSCLALVIVLDQFPRNIYRGTAAAFQHDTNALEVAKRGIAAAYLRDLHTVEQGFLLMPFQHSEDLPTQRAGVRRFEETVEEAPREWRPIAEGYLDYARRHLELIERFGRFPHRNEIVGRSSTPAEREYLASNAESFGQAKA